MDGDFPPDLETPAFLVHRFVLARMLPSSLLLYVLRNFVLIADYAYIKPELCIVTTFIVFVGL